MPVTDDTSPAAAADRSARHATSMVATHHRPHARHHLYVCAIAQNASGTSFSRVHTMATPYPAPDIDQNGLIDCNTDGLLVVRCMLGLRGLALVAGAGGANALRADAPGIEAHLDSLLK